MTITIGRFGTDPTVRNPSQITRAGDKVQVSGWVTATTKAAMNALIQQLNGLMGPDEPVVPLTYSYDSTWDGYYRVESVQHDLDPNSEKTFKFKYSVQLARFAAYPIVEMIVAGGDRTGNPGITEVPWHAVPSTWNGYDYGAITAIGVTRALTASTTMKVYEQAAFLNATATAGAAPAEAYTGAATIKMGSTLYTIHGRDTVNTPSNWELSNGLLKIGSTTGAGNHWVFATRNAAGTAWASNYGMTLGFESGGNYTVLPYGVTPRSVTVLRNSPEECVIRLAYQPETANSVAIAVDLGLRRGARHCTVTLRTHNNQLWGLGFETAVVCANISAFAVSIRENANNADGNRNFVGITDSSPTRDLTNGTILMSTTAGGSMDGFFGCSPGGGSAASPDGANEIEAEYYAAVSEKQRMAPQ